MKNKRGLLLMGLPLAAGLVLVVGALALRGPQERSPRRTRKPEVREVAPARRASAPAPVRYTRKDPPKPAPVDVVVSAANHARLRGTYKNFRTAVAKGSAPIKRALLKVLKLERDAAVKLAEEEVAKARTQRDRNIALQTLDALRR